MFGQVELYENHYEKSKLLLEAKQLPYPEIVTENFIDIFNWSFKDTKFINYQHGEKIDFPIAI
jgi:thymidylate synthase